jgi:pyridoxine/pyridoxamine 5'-phosphate oxidase
MATNLTSPPPEPSAPLIRGEAATDAARRVLDVITYLTLATADAAGRPWATPVWFAERDLREFTWVSRFETRHSRNIAERPEVSLAIFDSTVPVGSAIAVYVDATAEELVEGDLSGALDVFNARSIAQGLRAWRPSDVSGFAPHRLYRATASQAWVLDEEEHRVPLL